MDNTKTSKVSINYLLNLVYQVLAICLPIITTPYISRVLGVENIGVYSYTTSIVTYFSLAAVLGSSTFGQREISYNRDNMYKRSVVFWEIVFLRIATTALCLVMYLFFLFTFGGNLKEIYLVQSIVILSVIFDIGWFFSGIENFKILVLRNTLIKLLGIVFIFLAVKDENDLILYITGILGINFLGFLSLWTTLKKYICKVPLKEIHPFKNFRAVFNLFIPTIAIQVYTLLDKTMIGVITQESAQNGYYEQAEKIVKLLLTIITSMGTVMAPKISYLYSNKFNKEINTYLLKSFNFVFFLSVPMCFGLIITAEQFVPWFFGSGYDGIIPLMKIFSVLLIAIGMSNVSGTQYLISVGREKDYTKSVVAGASVNLVLNSALIYKFGAIGAAIASVISEICVSSTQLWLIRKDISVIGLLTNIKNYIIAGFAMFIACYGLKLLTENTALGFALTILVGIIVYASVLMIVRDKFIIELKTTVFSKLKKVIR